MRRTRRLILLLLTLIVAGVAIIYNIRKILRPGTPRPPASLPASVSAHADDWIWEETRHGKPIVRVRARTSG